MLSVEEGLFVDIICDIWGQRARFKSARTSGIFALINTTRSGFLCKTDWKFTSRIFSSYFVSQVVNLKLGLG